MLIAAFRFATLEAVILNKATSFVFVATALPFRMSIVSLSDLAVHRAIIINLLVGSLAGAWFGAGWATRSNPKRRLSERASECASERLRVEAHRGS